MPAMQPDQAAFVLNDVFLPSFKNEHQITKTVIAAIPVDKGDYRPDDISKSALDLAWHIVVTEMRFTDAIINGEFEFAPRPRPDAIHNSDDLTRWYAENFESRFGQLTQLTGEQLAKVMDFRGMFQLPAVMFLNFIQHHTIHHRGQLSTYLRPMGAKVPSMYGESYDASQARKAAG